MVSQLRYVKRGIILLVCIITAAYLLRSGQRHEDNVKAPTTQMTKPKHLQRLQHSSASNTSRVGKSGRAKSRRHGPPILLWWDSVYTSIDEVKACGGLQCRVSNNRSYQHHPDTQVFIFYGSHFQPYNLPFPRRQKHVWALIHEESPRNAYILSHGDAMTVFNVTSSYNRNSDYPIATQWLRCSDWLQDTTYVLPLVDKNRLRKAGLAPILYLHSDCDVPSDRDNFVTILQKYIAVDSYGTCVNNKKLPNRFRFQGNMSPMEDAHFYRFAARYKFTLAMENYICDDYVTEKFWRPLMLGSVPIVFGAPNIRDYLPTNKSAIIIEDYLDAEDLANYIRLLDSNDKLYRQYTTFKDSPLENKQLLRTLEARDWQSNDCKSSNTNKKKYHSSIFYGFECSLCKTAHEINDDVRKGGTRRELHANPAQYQCPSPRRFDERGRYTVHNDSWAEEWNYARYEAALMVTLHNAQKTLTRNEFQKEVKNLIKDETATLQ